MFKCPPATFVLVPGEKVNLAAKCIFYQYLAGADMEPCAKALAKYMAILEENLLWDWSAV